MWCRRSARAFSSVPVRIIPEPYRLRGATGSRRARVILHCETTARRVAAMAVRITRGIATEFGVNPGGENRIRALTPNYDITPYTDPMLRMSAFFSALLVAAHLAAQDYPARPIRLVLPQPPGGAVDFISRTLGAALQKSMGQAVVVDNRPGANGIVAGELVAKSAPDGYTLFMAVDTNLVVNPSLYAKVPYDPFRDFAPISVIARNGLVLVANNGFPPNSVAE